MLNSLSPGPGNYDVDISYISNFKIKLILYIFRGSLNHRIAVSNKYLGELIFNLMSDKKLNPINL